MIFFANLSSKLTDSRFDANLIAFYGLMVIVVLIALLLRRALARDAAHPPRWSGLGKLDSLGEEAVSHARRLLLWAAALAVSGISIAGLLYHLAGRDVRADFGSRLERLSEEDWLRLGMDSGVCLALLVAALVGVRLVRRLRPGLQKYAADVLGPFTHQETLQHWFDLLQRFAIAAVQLLAVWIGAHIIGLGPLGNVTVGLILRLVSIVVLARLITLSCGVITRVAVSLGDHHLGRGPFRRYWARLHLLLPFCERCFAWAVYGMAFSMFLHQLKFVSVYVADLADLHLGRRTVHCIGIVCATRLLIDMLEVLLNEAFGLHRENCPPNAKGRTLVPLVHSACQYVLYFGAAVFMLDVVGVNTAPILAGAGIVGLAVGLGSQNLVTDVVSGFFILLENQYLVGDYVQIGDAEGIIEVVAIRNTQLRDSQGKLHIIPNGQIKGIVSYSKGYINAVVDMKVPGGSDVEGTFRAMTEAGRQLREAYAEVLGETAVQGLVDLGSNDMTVRAVTRVQPGAHLRMQNEYRRILKQLIDQEKNKPQLAKAA